jgi:hypothetical protein
MNKCNPSAASSPRAGQALALLAITAAARRGQTYRQEQEYEDTYGRIVLKSSAGVCAARGQPGVPGGDGTDSGPGS